jgi:hypothetical protein
MTLLEVALMLTAMAALMAALMPTLTATIRSAQMVAALTAMTDIQGQSIAALNDLSYSAFTIDGAKNGTRVELLVSDGDIPRDVSPTGSGLWQLTVDNAAGLVDFLERHLVTNDPRGNGANGYSPPGGSGEWRGAYLTAPIDPDPWGNRYAVNAEFLGSGGPPPCGVGGGGGGTPCYDVVVYSAGPDEEIDTPYAGDPLLAADDDLVVLVEP